MASFVLVCCKRRKLSRAISINIFIKKRPEIGILEKGKLLKADMPGQYR